MCCTMGRAQAARCWHAQHWRPAAAVTWHSMMSPLRSSGRTPISSPGCKALAPGLAAVLQLQRALMAKVTPTEAPSKQSGFPHACPYFSVHLKTVCKNSSILVNAILMQGLGHTWRQAMGLRLLRACHAGAEDAGKGRKEGMANGVASELEPEWMILTWPRPMHFEHTALDDHPGLSGSRAKLSVSP